MRVVPALQKLKHGCLCLGFGAKGEALEQLALERRKEALAHRVVITVTHGTHRRFHPGRFTTRSEGHRGVLRSLIGMVNDLLRSARCERHIERAQYELG